MSDQIIHCPNCQTQISVAASLSSQIRQEIETDFAKQQAEFQKKLELERKQLSDQEQKLKQQSENLSKQLEEQLQKEKQKMWAIAKQEAEKVAIAKSESKVKELEEANLKATAELRKAEQQELELRKKSREIEEKAARMELEIQRKMDEERKKIAEESKKKADEEHRLKTLEKDKQLEQMRQQIEELRRKSEQGSMQIQGEVQEDDLKAMLQSHFPSDKVEDVEKGIRGADLVQTVRNSFGQQSGVILWESKNTKDWKDEWIKKLKEDQGLVNADICILVSAVLPKGIETFALIDNVWVVNYQSVLLLTAAVRVQLHQLSKMKLSMVGKDEKMEVLYQYLSGAQFRTRVENIVSAFSSMKADLDKEKRAFERIWKKREQEIERVITNTSSMYGDLQGIIGAGLPPVESLELPDGFNEEETQSELF